MTARFAQAWPVPRPEDAGPRSVVTGAHLIRLIDAGCDESTAAVGSNAGVTGK